ncbi:MAG: hypothetical protein M1832_001739 [Thelocarpon impressellum]|nr:MAG: hypothetical protein M1832_001739 [Thelocarpon impressellum]
MADEKEFWIFGYGSLIWKPPPHFDRRIPGYITGYVRRFWQASQDHRGTPEAPGRVVTLIERSFWKDLTDHHATAPDKVWGVAYRIEATKVDEVRSYLDLREINGYTIHHTAFHPADPTFKDIRTLVYIGTPDNPQFMGPQEPQGLAEHIFRSRGPSGENTEYLFMMERGLEELCPESGDEHVRDLAARVRAIEYSARGHPPGLQAIDLTVETPSLAQVTSVRSAESTDEQEEVEKE